MKNRGIKEKRFSFLKEHKLTAILFVICGLLLTLIPITASKYVTDKEVGTIDLTVTPPPSILMKGSDLKAKFPSKTTKIIFGKYSEYTSEVSGTTGENVGYNEKTQKVTARIKLYNKTSTAYILSDEDIYANPDSSGMFNGLKSLTSIEFNNFDTSKVEYMYSMFYNCSSLQNLDLSNFNTSQVTDMNWMFYCCTSLQNIDLSSFNTSQVTNMRAVFYECKRLTNLDLSSFNTSKVTNTINMFGDCSALTTIYVSEYNAEDNTGWTNSAMTASGSMFSTCTKLVGGSGTRYISSKTNGTYARIDGGTSNPGYLTDIKDKPTESA